MIQPSFVDTHCHIHDSEFFDREARDNAYRESRDINVSMICVGTDVRSSAEAIEFAKGHNHAWAIVGIHPHEAPSDEAGEIAKILKASSEKIVGIGEIGLDYFYDLKTRGEQKSLLREQLSLASEYHLPVSFHVRDEKPAHGSVWQDFWPIFDEFDNIRGVLHSFTDSIENLQAGMRRGLYIGVNGISTFTKDKAQQEMFREIPLDRLVFETDTPFLTPAPLRGKINIPAYVKLVAEFHAAERGISLEEIARITSRNAENVYGIKNE